MFTQRISMDCTKEQYEKFLKEELLKMGYHEQGMYWGRKGITVFTNAANGITGGMLDIEWGVKEGYGRTYLGSFNAPLFLALAAMTDKAEGNYGEYWVCIKYNAWFAKDNLYKSIGVYHDKSPMFYDDKGVENGVVIKQLFKYFRKATKEEIMAKFGDVKTGKKIEYPLDVTCKTDDESYFYATETQMISHLKSKGYKILKPKTWEEV